MDRQRNARQSGPVASDDERRGIGELLAAVAANVAAVPVVLGFVALGGVVLAGRALRGVAGQAVGSDAKRRSRKTRTPQPPASR
jgi:hypothetical protein